MLSINEGDYYSKKVESTYRNLAIIAGLKQKADAAERNNSCFDAILIRKDASYDSIKMLGSDFGEDLIPDFKLQKRIIIEILSQIVTTSPVSVLEKQAETLESFLKLLSDNFCIDIKFDGFCEKAVEIKAVIEMFLDSSKEPNLESRILLPPFFLKDFRAESGL